MSGRQVRTSRHHVTLTFTLTSSFSYCKSGYSSVYLLSLSVQVGVFWRRDVGFYWAIPTWFCCPVWEDVFFVGDEEWEGVTHTRHQPGDKGGSVIFAVSFGFSCPGLDWICIDTIFFNSLFKISGKSTYTILTGIKILKLEL